MSKSAVSKRKESKHERILRQARESAESKDSTCASPATFETEQEKPVSKERLNQRERNHVDKSEYCTQEGEHKNKKQKVFEKNKASVETREASKKTVADEAETVQNDLGDLPEKEEDHDFGGLVALSKPSRPSSQPVTGAKKEALLREVIPLWMKNPIDIQEFADAAQAQATLRSQHSAAPQLNHSRMRAGPRRPQRAGPEAQARHRRHGHPHALPRPDGGRGPPAAPPRRRGPDGRVVGCHARRLRLRPHRSPHRRRVGPSSANGSALSGSRAANGSALSGSALSVSRAGRQGAARPSPTAYPLSRCSHRTHTARTSPCCVRACGRVGVSHSPPPPLCMREPLLTRPSPRLSPPRPPAKRLHTFSASLH